MTNTEYINFINNIHSNIKYSENKKRILVYLDNVDDNFFKKKLYGQLFKFLQSTPIPNNTFKFENIKDIKLDFYFSCLLNYTTQIFKGSKHEDTCWAQNCERVVEYAYDKNNINFDKLKLKYHNVYNIDGWIKIKGIYPQDFNKNFVKCNYNRLKRIFYKKDRIIDLVEKIKANGWSDLKSSQKLKNKEISNGILGYSTKTKNFMVFHGKHRIIAAKYLYELKLLDNLTMKFPIIEYDTENFRQAKMISKCTCLV